jgi:hypothetical protein
VLISDTRDTLELALGGDAAWWRDTRMTGAPTRFSIVDVHLTLLRSPPRAVEPGRDATKRVRVADGERAVQALTAGQVVDQLWVMCPPNARKWSSAGGGARDVRRRHP